MALTSQAFAVGLRSLYVREVPISRINVGYSVQCLGMTGDMKLDWFDAGVARRAARWKAAGVSWQMIRWSPTEKPAVSLRAESIRATGELIVWASGEADLICALLPVLDEPVSEHYELTSRLGLEGCLDDFERFLAIE